MTQRRLARFSLLKSTLVCITILAQTDFAVCWWSCYQDACNVDETEQYCSEIDQKCRNCREIVGICLTKDMPFNCSKTCDEYIREQERASSCPALGDIENGRRRDGISSISRPGDAVHFSCDPGFKLEGSADLMCKACGQWSGTVPVCEAIACPPLTNIAHGDISGSTLKQMPGTKVTVTCSAGYRIIGKDTITCGPDGRWSSAPPICIEITCPEPPIVSHGQWSTGPKEKFSTGHTVSFHCMTGFTLEGSSVWNCSGGTWVSTSALIGHIPVCYKAEVSIAVYIAVTAVITGAISSVGTFFTLTVVRWCQRKKMSKYDRLSTQEADLITVSLDKTKKAPRPNLVGYEANDEKLKITDKLYQRENGGVMGNNNNSRRSGEQPENDASPAREKDKASTATQGNSVRNILNISIHNNNNNESSQDNTCYSQSNAGNMSDTRRHRDNSAPSENDQINDKEGQGKGTMPQQQKTDLNFPVTESQHSAAGPKCVSPEDHKDLTGDAQTGCVQQQGTEQDVNQKMTVGRTEFHVGDQNGANNAPDGVIPKPKLVAS